MKPTDRPQPSFLMIGETVVDLISSGIVSSLADANTFQRFPGGEVSNLSMNLARMGYPTALAGCVGEDGFGDFLKTKLKAAGVNLDLLQTTRQAPTTLVPVARQTETPDFIIYRGADKYLRLNEELRSAVDGCRVFHTSAGSLAHNPGRTTILELLKMAAEKDKLLSLDPNYHPRIWPDRTDFVPFLKDILSLITVAKPSLDDSVRIFGTGYEAEDYLEAFLDLGVQIVALTMGRKGVLLGTRDGLRVHLEAHPISVVDVTGAGDAFWSGLLTGLLEGMGPERAARLGQAIAEYKIGVLGPIQEFPERDYFLKQAGAVSQGEAL